MRIRWFIPVLIVPLLAMPALAAGAAGPPAAPAVGAEAGPLPHWVFLTLDYVVLSMLTLASIAGVARSIDAMLHLRQSKIAPAGSTERIRRLIESRNYKELLDFTATDPSFVSRALYAAIRRAHLKYAAMREGMESSIGEQTSAMFRRIEPLNVIGNIGPLLGLLGTVLGMIMAFYQLKQAHGEAKVEDLSLGISTALWHTFFGLFVAIPCLVVYGFYRTKADQIATRAALLAEELLEELRPEPSDAAAPDLRKKIPPLTEPAASPVMTQPI
jgi:biopolymer transport protein ExbB